MSAMNEEGKAMDRSKTVELMPIVWRLGTGKVYVDYPRRQDLAAVAAMGESVVPLLREWLEDDCCILRTGAAIALGRVATVLSRTVPTDGAVALASLI